MTGRDRPDVSHSPYKVAVSAETRDAQLHVAPAATRNIPPILEVLKGQMPLAGKALEIASGTGQHVCAFAEAFPGVHWTPSDVDGSARDSIRAWIASRKLKNVDDPIEIDVAGDGWHRVVERPLDVLCAINLIHISAWEATLGLMRGAGELLRDGAHTADSNAAFDASLKSRNAQWGVRDVDDVSAAAAGNGLALDAVVAMPANNLSLIFRRLPRN
ncbi:MAG: DUF938 domain-containing protein [Pseudomonadota bacterium]|nr:DUF938 domain-containing protein [Pseudomonadota bacterium]